VLHLTRMEYCLLPKRLSTESEDRGHPIIENGRPAGGDNDILEIEKQLY